MTALVGTITNHPTLGLVRITGSDPLTFEQVKTNPRAATAGAIAIGMVARVVSELPGLPRRIRRRCRTDMSLDDAYRMALEATASQDILSLGWYAAAEASHAVWQVNRDPEKSLAASARCARHAANAAGMDAAECEAIWQGLARLWPWHRPGKDEKIAAMVKAERDAMNAVLKIAAEVFGPVEHPDRPTPEET